jgi:hypothetical protein
MVTLKICECCRTINFCIMTVFLLVTSFPVGDSKRHLPPEPRRAVATPDT